jgi:hypothetical protein
LTGLSINCGAKRQQLDDVVKPAPPAPSTHRFESRVVAELGRKATLRVGPALPRKGYEGMACELGGRITDDGLLITLHEAVSARGVKMLAE